MEIKWKLTISRLYKPVSVGRVLNEKCLRSQITNDHSEDKPKLRVAKHNPDVAILSSKK